MGRAKKTPQTLTEACRKLLLELEQYLDAALDSDPAPGEENRLAELRADWNLAKEKRRTAHDFDSWRSELVTQIGASWVLSCVFVRFVEDNDLIDRSRISGPVDTDPAKDRRRRAEESERAYYREHADHGARDYFKSVFRELARLPGLDGLLDERHALFWRLTPTIEGGKRLLAFFRELDDTTGKLRWDLTDPELNTRFLGDLYQDLSESARKTYALLQTPDFIESFILDRTLEPAIETFGLKEVRMIDPTCGSGHFLLGSFRRLFEHWQQAEPGVDAAELARRSLDAVHGVDLNPFAAAIARFRLLVTALRASGTQRLANAPHFSIHVAVGDSLLHGGRFSQLTGKFSQHSPEFALAHLYAHEISDELRLILGRQYHAVVGNPPYITPKDKALSAGYRERFASCHREYALTVPFMERFVELALECRDGHQGGFVGQITSNSFMKREFGKKLIEEFFPRWDLTHVIDTSGAYIPGHGTPTVILFLRNRAPTGHSVRAVLGIRGEPSTPTDPARGEVWSAIQQQVDRPGSESEYVSVEDKKREVFGSHPWSIGGGGASDLKAIIEDRSESRLESHVYSIGFVCITKGDDIFVQANGVLARQQVELELVRPFGIGEELRNWSGEGQHQALFPYGDTIDAIDLKAHSGARRHLWAYRTSLGSRKVFGGLNYFDTGKPWWEYGQIPADRFKIPLSIAFAFVATHNHFVLDRGGKVFKQSAPVIKLPPEATEDDHFALLALLNSSTACFWGRNTFFCKGSTVDQDGARQTTIPFEDFYEWDSTKLLTFPLVDHSSASRARRLEELGRQLLARSPAWLAAQWKSASDRENAREAWRSILHRMISEQEELDWAIYKAYGLTDSELVQNLDDVPPLSLGERAFEIAMARKMEEGTLETTWFERHGSKPLTELPAHWPEAYRKLVEQRIALIEEDRNLGLLEEPEHKRRWNLDPWEKQVERALDEALLDRVEGLSLWKSPSPAPVSIGRLTELLEADEDFVRLVRLRYPESAPKMVALVAELVGGEGVPFLPSLYLEAAAMKKRAVWEETWRLQRIEDPFLQKQEEVLAKHFGSSPEDQKRAREHVACWLTSAKLSKEKQLTDDEVKALSKLRAEWRAIDEARRAAVGGATPPVPPKYASGDFRSSTCWRLRGKLDVPKERFITYPYCASEGDEAALVGWAGWDHAQRAAALVQVLSARKAEGWTGMRLAPILQGLDQLVFWLFQWHGEEHGAQYQQFVESETLAADLTLEQVRDWRPPEGGKRRGRPKKEREEPVEEDAE
ncbi:MAG: BREX-2 system adenine-specific DNA-methyltransferase PglX [Planctomycetota bacterium]